MSLAVILLLGAPAISCSQGDSNDPTPQELSRWAVAICSAITEFSASASALGTAVTPMSIEDTRRYAMDAASMLYESSQEAIQKLGAVTPPAGTTFLHDSVRAQMASIQELSEEAVERLPEAANLTEIRSLVLAILVASQKGDEDILEGLRDLSHEGRAAIDALTCPLPKQP